LASITISNTTSLSPSFSSSNQSYSVQVSNEVNSIIISSNSTHSQATIKVLNETIQSGTWSSSMILNVGINTINITCTAEDGHTNKIYSIEVNRLPCNYYLFYFY